MKNAYVFVVLIIFALSGCTANKNMLAESDGAMKVNREVAKPLKERLEERSLPSDVMREPIYGFSIKNLPEYRLEGVKFLTVFKIAMDPSLWAVVKDGFGVFPLIGCKDGQKYRAEAHTIRGEIDMELMVIAPYKEPEVQDVKWLLFNRDMGFAYNLEGQEIVYDASKYDDQDYFESLFETNGQTLSELNNYWKEDVVTEIEVDSPRWDKFVDYIYDRFTEEYIVPDGSIRRGLDSLGQMKELQSEIVGYTFFQRFVEGFKMGAYLPFTAAKAVGHIAKGVFDTSWNGYTARASVERYGLGPNFRDMAKHYKAIIEKQRQEIQNLQLKLNNG